MENVCGLGVFCVIYNCVFTLWYGNRKDDQDGITTVPKSKFCVAFISSYIVVFTCFRT